MWIETDPDRAINLDLAWMVRVRKYSTDEHGAQEIVAIVPFGEDEILAVYSTPQAAHNAYADLMLAIAQGRSSFAFPDEEEAKGGKDT